MLANQIAYRYITLTILVFSTLIAILHAAYIAIVGGSGIYFSVHLVLLMQCYLLYKLQSRQWSYITLAVIAICLVCYCIFTQYYLLIVPILIQSVAHYLDTKNKNNLMLILLVISIWLLLAIQQHDLTALKLYYASFSTGATWYQMGAL